MRIREWIQRLRGSWRPWRRDAELEEELRLHMEMAAEDAQLRGLAADDARRAARIRAGGLSQAMDALRDQRGMPWLDGLASDLVFAWRHMKRNRTATAAAILSLGLTIGATTAAFRLVDAVLLRPLPVREPDRLFYVAASVVDSQNRVDYSEYFDYPTFRKYVKTVGDLADLMVVGMNARQEVRFGGGDELERVYRQYLSGNVFGLFGLQPSLGRLLAPADDVTPGAHPVAVLSHHYWTRRFGRNPDVIGRTFRLGNQPYEIIGVAPNGFTGTEPGRLTDVFIPAAMNVKALDNPSWSWFRIWMRPRPGIAPNQIQEPLQAAFSVDHQERVKSFPSNTAQETIEKYLSERIALFPAGSGASGMQKTFRRPLWILAALVALVLLIACTNVANLLTAQATSRARELALRVSIGAGQWRLIQLVLVEAALLSIIASAIGTLFAAWSAPFVVSMLAPPEDPVRLVLNPDWRVLAFGVALTVAVTFLFGLAPAIRASSVGPLSALKGGPDFRSHHRLMTSLVGAEMAFCVFVVLISWLFVASFDRLSNRPLGFAPEHVLVLETEVRGEPQPSAIWAQVTEHLRQTPGVESAATSAWVPLTGNRWTSSVRVPGRPVEPRPLYALDVSPGFLETMRIGLIEGRDFRPDDRPPGSTTRPGVGIVNQTFARMHFDGQSPVGKWVSFGSGDDPSTAMEIVGLARDAVYSSVREAMPPTIYVPLEPRSNGTLIVRTSGDPLALASTLRREVSRARSDFIVRNVGTQSALVRRDVIRERLLSTLSVFFAVVALLLAGIGLYGVLNYAVIQQRREIGIRMALGARATHVVRRVATEKLGTVCIGGIIGLAGGLAFGRVIETLLFEVRAAAPLTLLTPLLTLAAAAVLAGLAPALRAVRIDPAQTLRAE